jgi:protein involved in polysaccharide export with SLBB domain
MAAVLSVLLPFSMGCHSILNGWLDPTVLGEFSTARTLEIRHTLTIEDTPGGIPGATLPTKDDLEFQAVEFPISAGDVLTVEVHELRQRFVTDRQQIRVSNTGVVNLPVLGRVTADGLTVPEFEDHIRHELVERQILMNPDVRVTPDFLQKSTYSIFGIGASAATNAPLRAGTFPIQRPSLRILEAINQVGGLNELVTEVYIFRDDDPSLHAGSEAPGATEPEPAPVPDTSAPPAALPEGNGNGGGPPPPPPAPGANGAAEEGGQAEIEDLMQAVDEPPAGQAPPVHEEGAVELPRDFEEELDTGYIWVNGEFVRRADAKSDADAIPGDLKTVTEWNARMPAIQWDRIAGEATYRIIRIPAEQLRAGDPEFNVFVRAGDVIRIVSGEVGLYYMAGQVLRPGPYSFNAEPVTLKTAIAAAGGLSALAWPDRCTVYRRLGEREQMIQVNLDRIFAGKDEDFYVRRGDIVNVGTHPFAPFLQRIRAYTLPTPASNVGYSFTYARNFADIDAYGARVNPHNVPDRFPGLFP